MTRMKVADVRAQVIRTAREDELDVAAGSNTVISRREQEGLAADLHDAAEEVRRRDPGGLVTVSEVAAVVGERFDAAVAAVNQPRGTGKPLLSREEVKNLAEREYFVGKRAQSAIELLTNPPLLSSHDLPGDEVHAKLRAILPSLTFDGLLGSEGGEPMEPVLVAGRYSAMPAGDELARALGHDPTTDKGFVERFRKPDASFLDELSDSNGGTPEAKQAIDLLRGLAELRVLIVGKDGGRDVSPNHPTYLVGLAKDGAVVGFKTGVIWT